MVKITQKEYLEYRHAVEDLQVVIKSYKKERFHKLHEVNGRISDKRIFNSNTTRFEKIAYALYDIAFNLFGGIFIFFYKIKWKHVQEAKDPLHLKNRITTVKTIYDKLSLSSDELLTETDSYPAALELYNSARVKTFAKWNEIFKGCKGLNMGSSYFSTQLIHEKGCSDDKLRIKEYLKLLKDNPDLKRESQENPYGVKFEQPYTKLELLNAQEHLCQKLREEGKSPEEAKSLSRLGLLYKGSEGYLVREVIVTARGEYYSFERFIKSCSVDGEGEAALFPTLRLEGETEDVVAFKIAYRGPIDKWCLELFKGQSKKDESAYEAALEELKKHHFEKIDNLIPAPYCSVFPDSTFLSSKIPVHEIKCRKEPGEQPLPLSDIAWVNLTDLSEAVINGHILLDRNGKSFKVKVKDPALLATVAKMALNGDLEKKIQNVSHDEESSDDESGRSSTSSSGSSSEDDSSDEE